MELNLLTTADQVTIKLKGRMDAVWSDHVGRALADCMRSGHHSLNLDMAEVGYLSSAGIRILMLYAKQLRAIGGRFAVCNASEMVRKVLTLAGLEPLLLGPAVPAPTATPSQPLDQTRSMPLPETGATAEVYDLEPQAALRLDWLGNPQPWLEGRGETDQGQTVEFGPNTIGIGLGGFGGGDLATAAAFGEFIAAGGAAVCQPADGSNRPDYMLQQGALTPSVRVAYGLVARGGFSRLVRFDKGGHDRGVPMSSVARACLQATAAPAAGIVMVAETASLVGASLQKSPQPPGPTPIPAPAAGRLAGEPAGATATAPSLFAFPAVRRHLSFTAEAAFANGVSLVVGFVAEKSAAEGWQLFRPLIASGELAGHFHAAAFPYRPLRKGRVAPASSVLPLFDNENVLGVLHLLNDWREASGAGECLFLRGACWCAPLVVSSL